MHYVGEERRRGIDARGIERIDFEMGFTYPNSDATEMFVNIRREEWTRNTMRQISDHR